MIRLRIGLGWLNGVMAAHNFGWGMYWVSQWSHPGLVLMNLGSAALAGAAGYSMVTTGRRLRERLRELKAREYLLQERERLLVERSTVDELAEIYRKRDA